MATKTPNLELVELQLADLQAAPSFNESMYKLDGIVHLAVISRMQNAPSGSEAQGDRFIVPDIGSTGLFAGKGRKIAYLGPEGWLFFTPRHGWFALVEDEELYYSFGSDGEWHDTGIKSGGGADTGISLVDLTDVEIHGPTDGQILTYDTIVGKWTAADDVFQKGAQWVDVGGAEVATPTNDVIAILPKACRLIRVIICGLGGPGSCVIGIASDTSAHYPPDNFADDITGGSPPEISSGDEGIDTVLAGYTKTSFAAGDSLRFTLVTSTTFTLVQIILEFV